MRRTVVPLLTTLVLGAGCSLSDPGEEFSEEQAFPLADRVTICHSGRTQTVNQSALPSHLAHGDTVGFCGQVCVPGAAAACYSGPAGTAGVGTCSAGSMTCNADGLGYGACNDEVTPAPDACGDGLDNDCNGATDEGCVCAPGPTAPCYSGPAGTAGVGTCSAGSMTCNADGLGYGACNDEVTPAPDVCGDGLDNDCDEATDEGCVCAPGSTAPCYSGPAGTAGVGSCSTGSMTCSADGLGYGDCVGQVTPVPDVCGNGSDDDCNGSVDETCVCTPLSTTACYTGPGGTEGVGACSAGTQSCNAAGTAYGACVGQVTPSSEVCGNGSDDDCDGVADEGCIGNRAWNDLDGDGIQDSDEPGLAGVTFFLRSASTGALVAVSVSNTSGAYFLGPVPPGTYFIEVIALGAFQLTAVDAGTDDDSDSDFDGESMEVAEFTVGTGMSIGNIDCGFVSSIQP